eukprot:569211-Prorocentrum_minimum.AAC.1
MGGQSVNRAANAVNDGGAAGKRSDRTKQPAVRNTAQQRGFSKKLGLEGVLEGFFGGFQRGSRGVLEPTKTSKGRLYSANCSSQINFIISFTLTITSHTPKLLT